MKHRILQIVVIMSLSLGLSGLAYAAGDGWKVYNWDSLGISMKIPNGMKMKEVDLDDGWGALKGTIRGATLWAIGSFGKPKKAKSIKAFGAKVTGVPAKHWKIIGQGKKKNGWKWYKTIKSVDGKTLIFGGYGVGPKGSYLFLIKSTKLHFKKHKADYKKWYESVRLY